MQGEGCPCRPREAPASPTSSTSLGIDLIEAGFPASNSQGGASCSACSRASASPTPDRRLRHDAAGAVSPRPTTRRSWRSPAASPRSARWSADLGRLPSTSSSRLTREENLRMIRRVDRPSCARPAKRVIYDAEHYFDGYRAEPDYALACIRAAADAGAETVTLCDTNGSSRLAVYRPRRAPRSASSATPCGSESIVTTTQSAPSPTRWPRSRSARVRSRAR